MGRLTPSSGRQTQVTSSDNGSMCKSSANVPQAKVTGEFDISLNAVAVQLNGATLAQVAAAQQVKRAEYQGLYRPTVTDPDLAIIKAKEAWAAGGSKGDGVKIAIVDTGIDTTHPCFDDTGYTAQTQLGDRSFTNNKVIAARVFNNKTQARNTPPRRFRITARTSRDSSLHENTPARDGVTTRHVGRRAAGLLKLHVLG